MRTEPDRIAKLHRAANEAAIRVGQAIEALRAAEAAYLRAHEAAKAAREGRDA